MESKLDLVEVLNHVDPAMLNYQEWVDVGMALKHEGYTASDWDSWSQRDYGRYHPGETFKKWESFVGATGSPITGGTIVQMAKDQGFRFGSSGDAGHELDWDDTIEHDNLIVVDKNWIEGQKLNRLRILIQSKKLPLIFQRCSMLQKMSVMSLILIRKTRNISRQTKARGIEPPVN